LADVESRLGVTNAQLIVAHRDLDDSKTLLSDAQQQLLEIQNRLAIEQQEHLVTKQHLRIAQQALSDFQDTVSAAQQFNHEVNNLRRDRDRALHALNFARDSLDPSSLPFDLAASDFDFSVESFAHGVASRLTNRHHRAEEERDEYLTANKEYAKELRALRAEHIDSLRRIQDLKAENLQLRADLASSKRPSSVRDP
jgi:hypothetical protein